MLHWHVAQEYERYGVGMNVKNCRGCGRIFNYVAGPFLCQVCKERMEVKFQEVKEYIRANPGVGINEVSVACDVSASQIQQWLREERLEVTEDSPIYLSCEGCGANIRFGKYCDKCKSNLASDLRSAANSYKTKQTEAAPKKKDPKDNPKMRYLN